MELMGVRFENGDDYGVEGFLPLRSMTVLFGKNGTGKTRYLEHCMSLLDPDRPSRRQPRDQDPSWPYGWEYLTFDPEQDWPWLALVLWGSRESSRSLLGGWFDESSPDVADPLEMVWPGAKHMGEIVYWIARGPNEDGPPPEYAEFAEALALHVVATGPDDRLVGPESDRARALLRELLAAPLISVQTFPGGAVGVAFDPNRPMDRTLLPQLAETPSSDDFRLIDQVLDRVADPGSDLRELFTLATATWGESRPFDQLGLRDPGVPHAVEIVEIPDEPVDAERVLHLGLEALLDRGRAHWLTKAEEGWRFSDRALELVARLEREANELAPDFVAEQGRIRVTIVDPESWGADRPYVAISMDLVEGRSAEFPMLGAGTRRWAGASVLEALRRLESEAGFGSLALFVVDEPELHLHPSAQHDVAGWLAQRADEGHKVLTATHSPALLVAGTEVDVLAVSRRNNVSMVAPISSDVTGSIESMADELGVDARVWLQLTRAVLIVEGEHDRRVVRKFFGPELDKRQIRILPIQGTRNSSAFGDSKFIGRVGIPLRVMFDAVRPGAITGEIEAADFSPEEKKLSTILEQFGYQRAEGHDIAPIPFDLPDIWCALPEAAVRRAFPDCRFPGWAGIIDSWSENKNQGFKPKALKMARIKVANSDEFFDRVIAALRDDDPPSPELWASMQILFAHGP